MSELTDRFRSRHAPGAAPLAHPELLGRRLGFFWVSAPLGALLQVGQNLLHLAEGGTQVVGDLAREHVGLGQVGGILQALVAQPDEVQAHLVAADDLVIRIGPPAPLRLLLRPRRLAGMAGTRPVAGHELVEVGTRVMRRVFSVKCLFVRRS